MCAMSVGFWNWSRPGQSASYDIKF